MISLSFIASVLVLFYLTTLFLFAILRIFTGISIQRIGFSGVRRVKYSPKDGLRLEIRGLGLHIHRPTFARPTWLSLVVSELRLTIDFTKLRPPVPEIVTSEPELEDKQDQDGASSSDTSRKETSNSDKKTIWTTLTRVKNQIKLLQGKIAWLQLLDVMAERTSVVIAGVGAFEVGSCTLQVDTRTMTVDRTRLFHHTPQKTEQLPAEWTLDFRTMSFVPLDQDPVELLDYGVLNIHGFMNPNVAGLRDASVSVKIGRLNLPYDALSEAFYRIKSQQPPKPHPALASSAVSQPEISHEVALLATLEDAKEFLSSTIHGIRDVSVLIAYVGTSMQVDYVRPGGNPLYLNMSMREIGLDIYRLDSSTPAHSMYFSRNDVAHQALLSALAFSLGIDDAHAHPERLVYVPMTTATLRTTLPGKLVEYAERKGDLELNTNVLLANLVVTSPSVDLDPRHLPVLLAVPLNRGHVQSTSKPHRSFGAAYQLLPKLSMKLLIHEPVVRVAMPPVQKTAAPGAFDFDLIISAISSVSFDIDASHSVSQERRYAILSHMRVVSHRLYYQTRLKETQDLIVLDNIELKSQFTAMPAISVAVSCTFQTISYFMVKPEMSEALRQIIVQLRSDVIPEKSTRKQSANNPNPLRALPPWLDCVELHANDLTFEAAAVDKKLSPMSRGLALQIESWSADYRAYKENHKPKRPITARRRNVSQSVLLDDHVSKSGANRSRSSSSAGQTTDGRRFAMHLKGFEAFVIEDVDTWDSKPCLSIPRSEVALTTMHDDHGPVSSINCFVKAVYVDYSLFRHYSVGVAVSSLRHTFLRRRDVKPKPLGKLSQTTRSIEPPHNPPSSPEYIAVDVKVSFVQIKAQLPTEPDLMLHMETLEGGRRRFTHLHGQGAHMRLYAQSPTVRKAWSRLVSIKAPRLDLREMNRVTGGLVSIDRSIDFVSDAIRIGIPHQLVIHQIFDNIVNTAKTAAQLHHRFKTESDEYILAKHPEGPKLVPKVTVRTHVFVFEIEDGPFEWKLGCIYRTGLVEQKQRIAREEAFRLKADKTAMNKDKSNPDSAYRASPRRSQDGARPASPSKRRSLSPRDNQSPLTKGHTDTSPSRSGRSGYGLRYDKRGTCNLSSAARTPTDEAWETLQIYNSQSWRKRIDSALSYQSTAVRDVRNLLWGVDSSSHESYHNETILQLPTRPALMQVLMSDLNVTIEKPSFPLSKLPDFLHDVGKGLPRDTEFGLLVPMHWSFEMGETRAALRDYPLPLLHIPAINPGQQPRLPSWSMKTNFVVAEEYRNFESTRDLKIMVIPREKMGPYKNARGFAVDVRRTVSPVKTYSDMKIEINTSKDSRFTWGASYQAAIQDMMQVVEGFSKAQIDPSDKVGFWDKIRLSFHSRINVAWKRDGDVHLVLKGTRDPYVVIGHGAGLIMIWRNGVQWNIGQSDDPREFMTVDSGDFVLAVPDFNHYARSSPDMMTSQAQNHSVSPSQHEQKLKKVIMKLSGKVRWQAGMVFERDTADGKRSFDFIPHHEVTLKNPAHIKSIKHQKDYDAFRGFRSNHIHMSIAIIAPPDRKWSGGSAEPSTNYNSVHFSPRFFTHFYAWWSMFSGSMSLPVHTGPLFPGIEKSGKKFGRHLATIKYSLLLAPLYIGHVYKHKDADEWAEDTVSATGLKMRLDSFVLDLHQRREEFTSEVKGLNKVVKTAGMRINQTLLDLVGADVRAVSASLTGTSKDAVRHASSEVLKSYSDSPQVISLSNITIPDNDYRWIDADDFVEIDWSLPVSSEPKTQILPLAYAPRFTYRRQTDHTDNIHGDENRHSAFGYEHTHECVMSSGNDPRQVQIGLIEERIANIDKLMEKHKRTMDEQQLQAVKETDTRQPEGHKLDELREHGAILAGKRTFLKRMLSELLMRMDDKASRTSGATENISEPKYASGKESHAGATRTFTSDTDTQGIDLSSLPDYVSDFNNRFVVHNAQIKWNNSLRNIMLRYIHQMSQRRGFIYYTSRRAVKFILDIIEDQKKTKQKTDSPTKDPNLPEPSQRSSIEEDEELDVQARISELLNDGNKFVNADDSDTSKANREPSVAGTAAENVSHNFMAQNSYHLRLIAPQIQLQSEKNTKAIILVTARGMRLKVLEIVDKGHSEDDVSGLVQTRFAAEMDNIQFFATTKKTLSPQFLKLFAGNLYGTSGGSAWPPWAPIEAMFDFSVNTYGFQRVVQRTTASLRYDKYNNLRLKYNDNVNNDDTRHLHGDGDAESRMDHLWVEFPQVRAICDSAQYYAIYVIILDLLMWTEPLEKTRHERLEKIMLASDFSDLTGAPELVTRLQGRIRDLNEIKTHFHVHELTVDRRGWEDRIHIEQDLALCEEELFFIMKAITTSQQKLEDRLEGAVGTGIMKWFLSASEIVWHLTKEADKPLAEFQLNHAHYERTDNSDGSNLNVVEVDRLYGVSLLPNSIYPEMITAHQDAHDPDLKRKKMLQVRWLKLAAIAGINVVDHFEVNLHPLRVQLDYDTGKQLFEYVFPGMGGDEEGFSPFMVRHRLPASEEADEQQEEMLERARQASMDEATKDNESMPGMSAGAGLLEYRLQPTFKLPDRKAQSRTSSTKAKPMSRHLGVASNYRAVLNNFNGSKTSLVSTQAKPNPQASADSLSIASTSRGRTSSTFSGTTGHEKEHGFLKRFGVRRTHRSPSAESRVESKKDKKELAKKDKKDKEKDKDDLSQMLNRASNYMTLAYVKIDSVILCLSIRGRSRYEDVHNLVFRLPTLEYRNKTWSNLDLALALKKDVIRALISHTGAIIGNKFTHHRPGKHQINRLQELARSSALMSSSDTISRLSSDGASSILPMEAFGDERPIHHTENGEMDYYGTPSEVSTDDRESLEERQSERPRLTSTISSLTARTRDSHPVEGVKNKLTQGLSAVAHIGRRRDTVSSMEKARTLEREDGEDGTVRKVSGLKKKFLGALDRA